MLVADFWFFFKILRFGSVFFWMQIVVAGDGLGRGWRWIEAVLGEQSCVGLVGGRSCGGRSWR